MSLSNNLSNQKGNQINVFVQKNLLQYQKVDETIPIVLFVILNTFSINLFWRKSFVLHRDLPLSVLSEMFAIVVLNADSWGLHMIVVVTIIVCCVSNWIFKSGRVAQKPRNALDHQDLINFILTSFTIYVLVQQSNQLFIKETIEEKRVHFMKLWASIPILSLFQLIR